MKERLSDIPVEVISPAPQGTCSANIALPVLNEIATMLEVLVNSGLENSIDLRRTPLVRGDYEVLRDTLGQGEVKAELDCLGLTRVRETAVRGVWWMTHFSPDGHIQGEFIEITTCPEMFRAHDTDLVGGLHLLRSRIDGLGRGIDQVSIDKHLRALGFDQVNASSSHSDLKHELKRG